jgi:PPOX class probable F420-dependent enzyme
VSTPIALPAPVLELLRSGVRCFVATTDADGKPQLTQTWVDTDRTHVLVNTVEGHRKLANLRRDPRVSVAVCGTDDAAYWGLRGHVVAFTKEGAAEHIDELAQRYTGGPYRAVPGSAGARVLLRIAVDRVVHRPW